MTDIQRADLEAGQRGKEFNSANSTALGVLIGVDDTLAAFVAGIIEQVLAVETAESAQQQDSGDVSDEKALLKAEMGKSVIKYALRGELKAHAIGNSTIEGKLQHPVTYIVGEDDVLSVTRANDMKKVMDDNKGPGGVLTNIIADDIAVMTTAIGAFKDIANKPTDAIKEKKAQGTDKIQPEIDKLNSFTEMESKYLHSYWADTANSGLVDEFDLKIHPVVLGKRHNIVEATMVKDENGAILPGGIFTCLKNDKKSDGGKTNIYKIEGIPLGIQSFTAEAPGRVAQSIDIKVLKGRTVEVIIRMKLV